MGLDMTLHVIEEEEMTSELLAEQDYEYWAKGEHFYWRKANSIHNWFVKNVQGGTDDCGIYEVTFDQLMSLKSRVASVLADNRKGPELLPTTAGFFFGSTEYDDFYLEDMVETLNHLSECEKIHSNNPSVKFFYSSSW